MPRLFRSGQEGKDARAETKTQKVFEKFSRSFQGAHIRSPLRQASEFTAAPQTPKRFPGGETFTFFHPDYTVGPGVSPDHASLTDTRGLYHRSGIVPWSFRRKLPKVRLRRTDTHLAPKVIQLS